MDNIILVVSLLSALGVTTFFWKKIENKLDKNIEMQKEIAKEHWEYESMNLSCLQATSDLNIRVARFAIERGCNGNTKPLLADAEKTNADLKSLIQKRATKNI